MLRRTFMVVALTGVLFSSAACAQSKNPVAEKAVVPAAEEAAATVPAAAIAAESSTESPIVEALNAQMDAAVAEQSSELPDAESGAEDLLLSESGEVSLDFRDADIQNVLKILSYKSGVNIVAGPEVTGLVTIKLGKVPWKQALDVILQTYGYTYEQRGNIIVVTTVENMKKRREDTALLAEQEPLQTRTFIMNYAKASDTLASIEKMRTERGSINYDERTNTIIVRDTSANVELIAEVIRKLDSATPQILIETKIIETTLSNTENLGISWTVQGTVSGMKRPTIFPYTNQSSNVGFIPDAIPAVTGTSNFTYGTIDLTSFQAALELLSSRSDTNILSNPRIVTLDNQTAKIEVGTDRPIPNYSYNEEQGSYQVDGFQWRTIGIIFSVTPHVNSKGFVTLDLSPEVSELAGTVPFDNIDLPLVGKKTANTRVMVKDGDTLVIGGLIKDEQTDIKRKVPFLGDIPIFGWFFQKTEKTVTKTDLLIFLTPHIITPDTAAKTEKAK